ncbi:MAG: S41 family peptidase [Bacteroidales bacterium]|nr:S41 family peptidase [Bacteroidales bacterium]
MKTLISLRNYGMILILYMLFSTMLLPVNAQEQEKTVDRAEQQLVVDSVCAILNANYIYPETAKKIEDLLRANMMKGVYETLTDPEAFAGQLTKDLQSISNDKHLWVGYNPEQIALLKKSQENPDDKEYERLLLEQLRNNNYGFKELKIMEGNIGYLGLNQFSGTDFPEAGEAAIAAMTFLSHCDAIIIDLRGNGGGSPDMIQLLTSYLYEGDTRHLNSFYWRPEDKTVQFWTLPYVPGHRMPKVDVYVLTSPRTFSAAEEFTYNLKNMKRAVIVGETTGGGAHPVNRRIINDNFGISVPTGKAINPITQTNWEGTGIVPCVQVPEKDALAKAHLLAIDSLGRKTEDEKKKEAYKWISERLNVQLNPVILDTKLSERYTGTYGPRTITFENGSLYYQREGRPKYKMIPVNETLFMFDELDYFMLEIIVENEKGVALVGHYDDGRTDRNERSK